MHFTSPYGVQLSPFEHANFFRKRMFLLSEHARKWIIATIFRKWMIWTRVCVYVYIRKRMIMVDGNIHKRMIWTSQMLRALVYAGRSVMVSKLPNEGFVGVSETWTFFAQVQIQDHVMSNVCVLVTGLTWPNEGFVGGLEYLTGWKTFALSRLGNRIPNAYPRYTSLVITTP